MKCPALRESSPGQEPPKVCGATGLSGYRMKRGCPVPTTTDDNCNVKGRLPVYFRREWQEKKARALDVDSKRITDGKAF